MRNNSFITVSEVASQLNVPLPRLLRHLKKDKFAEFIIRESRVTKTGLRTVTKIDESIIYELKSAIQSRNTLKNKYKQKYNQKLNDTVQMQSEDVRLDELLVGLNEKIALLNQLVLEISAERNRLLEEKKWLYLRIEKLEDEVAKNRELLAQQTPKRKILTKKRRGYYPDGEGWTSGF